MATVTPNIGLTKPAGTENVNLTVINENYDKIDAAFGAMQTNLNAKQNGLSIYVTSEKSYSVPANSMTQISQAEVDLSELNCNHIYGAYILYEGTFMPYLIFQPVVKHLQKVMVYAYHHNTQNSAQTVKWKLAVVYD